MSALEQFDLDDQRALVTGGTRGIGLSEAGATVVPASHTGRP